MAIVGRHAEPKLGNAVVSNDHTDLGESSLQGRQERGAWAARCVLGGVVRGV